MGSACEPAPPTGLGRYRWFGFWPRDFHTVCCKSLPEQPRTVLRLLRYIGTPDRIKLRDVRCGRNGRRASRRRSRRWFRHRAPARTRRRRSRAASGGVARSRAPTPRTGLTRSRQRRHRDGEQAADQADDQPLRADRAGEQPARGRSREAPPVPRAAGGPRARTGWPSGSIPPRTASPTSVAPLASTIVRSSSIDCT